MPYSIDPISCVRHDLNEMTREAQRFDIGPHSEHVGAMNLLFNVVSCDKSKRDRHLQTAKHMTDQYT
jgi:hypothetical protein